MHPCDENSWTRTGPSPAGTSAETAAELFPGTGLVVDDEDLLTQKQAKRRRAIGEICPSLRLPNKSDIEEGKKGGDKTKSENQRCFPEKI